MATEAKLRQLADRGCPVYYFYSSERYLVRQAVSAAVRILSADTDEETTVQMCIRDRHSTVRQHLQGKPARPLFCRRKA